MCHLKNIWAVVVTQLEEWSHLIMEGMSLNLPIVQFLFHIYLILKKIVCLLFKPRTSEWKGQINPMGHDDHHSNNFNYIFF